MITDNPSMFTDDTKKKKLASTGIQEKKKFRQNEKIIQFDFADISLFILSQVFGIGGPLLDVILLQV